MHNLPHTASNCLKQSHYYPSTASFESKDMAILNRINIAALLAFLTANQNHVPLVSADVFVCGSDYSEASKNCTVNPACPSGEGCPSDKATCFVIPDDKCLGPTIFPSVAPSLSPMLVCGFSYDDALTNCRSNPECLDAKCENATHACFPIAVDLCPTSAPSYSPTTIPKVCGVDAFDAQANCLDLSMRCPSGDGCPSGKACFSVPADTCGSLKEPTMSPSVVMMTDSTMSPSATSTSQTTMSPSAMSTNQTMSPSDVLETTTTTSNPTITPTTAMPTTSVPTASPIYSAFFCGETYELAEANCWTAEPCPSGSGCSKEGEDCFGISTDRCYSPAPTETPTGPGPRPSASPSVSTAPTYGPSTSRIPTMLPTLSPSASPIVNTFYCGVDYDDAMSRCDSATPCPSGAGCPSDMTCFGNIQCSTASPASIAETIATSAPSVPSTTITEGTGSVAPTVTAAPSSISEPSSSMPPYWEDIGEQTSTPQNATATGSTSVPSQSVTSSPQPLPTSSSIISASAKPTPISSSSSNTNVPTMSQVEFDPTNTFYCGDDYNDAATNCFTQVPCPNGEMGECPTGQSCFLIASCSSPSPAASSSSGATTMANGLQSMTPSATILPSSNSSGTLAPTWDFSSFTGSSDKSGCTDVMTMNFFVKSVFWVGGMFGVLIM